MTELMAGLRPRIRQSVNAMLGRFGWQLVRRTPFEPHLLPALDKDAIAGIPAVPPLGMPSPERDANVPDDFDDETVALVRAVSPYTMTSPERIGALVNALRYVSQFQIPGAVVECGVWRGGSMMAIAKILQARKDFRDGGFHQSAQRVL